MTTFSAILTNAGAALYASAVASSTPIVLTTAAVGDGNGAPVVTPDPARTTLVRQVYSAPLNSLSVDPNDPTLIWASLLIAAATGGWTIREVGLFTQNGTLFAIANFPETYKPVTGDGSTRDLVINFGMRASNASLITLTIDPNVVGATRAWVLSTITPAYLFPGGTQYQVLKKNSATAGDASWQDADAPWQYAVATTGGVVTVTALQAYNKLIKVTGALTANATLTMPAALGKWTVINATTGAFSLTVIALGGAGVPILQGRADSVYCDGVNVAYSHASASTRPAGDNSLAIANTAYADSAASSAGGCYLDTGLANAYVLVTAPVTTAYLNGMSFRFSVANANTGACTLNVGLGVKPLVRNDGAPAKAGDFPLNALVVATYNLASASWYVASMVLSQLGTSAKLNASDQVGGVSATQNYAGNPNGFVAGNAALGLLPPSTCWDSVNRWMWICVTTGPAATAAWVVAAPTALSSAPRFINASAQLAAGVYLTNTSAAPFTITLSAAPALGDSLQLIDGPGSWATNNLTIGRNGNTINGSATDLICNVAGEVFLIWFNGTEWRIE